MFTVAKRPLRILDFDIENRPLHYWYGDATTAEITAIAWSWYDQDRVEVAFLEPPPDHIESMQNMLSRFLRAYDEADMVTGHFIRGHDLPIINAALIEAGFPTLSSKLTSDTKLDLIKRGSMSASQKNLSEMLDVKYPKVDMPQGSWREANRLTNDGIALAVARVKGDIHQHKALRTEMIARKLLGEPRMWHPSGGGTTKYTP